MIRTLFKGYKNVSYNILLKLFLKIQLFELTLFLKIQIFE